MSAYWAEPPCRREQIALFSPSLDELIGADDPVRRLEGLLDQIDWGGWERCYHGHRGQPPIHPRRIAGAILYGLLRGCRSSRQLEEATRRRVDFMWLLDAMSIDHSTFAGFRAKHQEQLKGLFHQLNEQALRRAESVLVELSMDGTQIRSWSARGGARSAEQLRKACVKVQEQFEEALEELAASDAREEPDAADREGLEAALSRLESEKIKLQEALDRARERDAIKQAKEGKNAPAVRVPVTDPDSRILPNKEGGYAPNYTTVVSVEKETELILSADVLENGNENGSVGPAVEEIEESYEQTPQRVLCDSGFGSGANQARLAEQNIAVYTPVETLSPEKNPAWRADPCEPVAKELWGQLPRRNRGRQLDRNAFMYDSEQDCYWCPMGRRLKRERRSKRSTNQGPMYSTSYLCESCKGCELATVCLSAKASARRVIRDEYEPWREQTSVRMNSEEGRAIYRRRAPMVETVFGHIKATMGIRQFWTRGLDKVRTEWLWVCTAYNLNKLIARGQSATGAAHA